MSRQPDAFDTARSPRLDAARLVRGPLAWLTPNRLILACRLALGMMVLVTLAAGPEGLDGIGLRFAMAYGVTILALPAFPRVGGRTIGGALALLFAARWAFSTLNEGTAEMLMAQLAGIVCALAPVYARNVGGLAGSSEGHISFTERRTMWHQRSAARPQPTGRGTPTPAATPVTALLDYRPET